MKLILKGVRVGETQTLTLWFAPILKFYYPGLPHVGDVVSPVMMHSELSAALSACVLFPFFLEAASTRNILEGNFESTPAVCIHSVHWTISSRIFLMVAVSRKSMHAQGIEIKRAFVCVCVS